MASESKPRANKMTIKIFLGNLSSETTADKVRPLFEKYGEVVECDVLKNFGFVHMVNKNEANKAIAQLDGYSIDGNNIRVELSTGKKGGGGSGKFDKKGFGGGMNRSRPYGPLPGRGDPRDFDRYPYPPTPPVPFDRYDPYYRYYAEREAYYSRLAPLPGDRGYSAAGSRDRYPPLPRDRLNDRFPPDPRDRLAPPRSYLDDRARGPPQSDPYFRERDPLAARPPPEYYDRKPLSAGRSDQAGAAGGGRGVASGAYGNGVGGGDFYRGLDRAGAGLGGAAGGAGAADYFRAGGQSTYNRPGLGGMGGKAGDSQSSFAQDAIFF